MGMNVDHREKGLFNFGELTTTSKKGIKSWLEGWFGKWVDDDDFREEWNKRSTVWGIDVAVDEKLASSIRTFTPPKAISNVVLKATKLGENEYIRKGFALTEPMKIHLYALGEGVRNDYELVDYGWIMNTEDRSRVWQMKWRDSEDAGGASKNVIVNENISLPKGEYTLYYVSDNSHSSVDWNCAPLYDPLNYGATISVNNEKDKSNFKIIDVKEDAGIVFLSITKVGDDENRSEAFTLKQARQSPHLCDRRAQQ